VTCKPYGAFNSVYYEAREESLLPVQPCAAKEECLKSFKKAEKFKTIKVEIIFTITGHGFNQP
jgi:hypothetical protein